MKIVRKRYSPILFFSLIFFSSILPIQARLLDYHSYEKNVTRAFILNLSKQGDVFYPEWNLSSEQKINFLSCVKVAFDQYEEMTKRPIADSPDDKAFQGDCLGTEPQIKFLIKQKNVNYHIQEISFFQDKMLNKGGFKYIYPGIKLTFSSRGDVDLLHIITGTFVRPNEYQYHKKNERIRFLNLTRPTFAVESYDFLESQNGINYISQKRYVSWKDMDEKKIFFSLPLYQRYLAVSDIEKGLRQFHVIGFVHGDIKEDNIFFEWSVREKRYVALIGDLDGCGPYGKGGTIYTKGYLSNINFIRLALGKNFFISKYDDLFAASLIAEYFITGKSSRVLDTRYEDLFIKNKKEKIYKIYKHNKFCQKMSRHEIKNKKLRHTINDLRCKK